MVGILIALFISGCSYAQQPSSSFTEPPSAPPPSITAPPPEAPNDAQTTVPIAPPPNAAPESIALRIDFGDGTIEQNDELKITNYEEGETLWLIMQRELAKKGIALEYDNYGGEFGVLITQIGDKKNGEGGRYWQYFVNGKYATTGASTYRVKAGDVIEWRFTNDKS